MALITCPECGKKVSDTVKLCIHCGAPIIKEEQTTVPVTEAETPVAETAETVPEATTPEENVTAEPQRLSFAQLDSDTRDALEAEFVSRNKWAKKCLRARKESTTFIWWGFGPLVLSFVLGRGFYAFASLLLPEAVERLLAGADVIHPAFEKLAIACLVLYGVLFVAMIAYGIVTKVLYGRTRVKFAYMKRFGRWLEREKNISYEPPLAYMQEKKLYDSIVIEEDQ